MGDAIALLIDQGLFDVARAGPHSQSFIREKAGCQRFLLPETFVYRDDLGSRFRGNDDFQASKLSNSEQLRIISNGNRVRIGAGAGVETWPNCQLARANFTGIYRMHGMNRILRDGLFPIMGRFAGRPSTEVETHYQLPTAIRVLLADRWVTRLPC